MRRNTSTRAPEGALFYFSQDNPLGKVPFDPSTMRIETIADREVVHPDRLNVDWIRSRFSNPPAWQPEDRLEKRLPTAFDPPMPASVLVPIVARAEGPAMLLTKRTDHLHHHPSQVSFPGGRVEESDTSPIETALRETMEEVGLHRGHIDIIGRLPEYVTGTGYRVTPIVSIVTPPFELEPDSFEVAEVLEVPLSHLMNAMNHRLLTAEFPNGIGWRSFYAIPYEKYFIWGATAGMLRNLFHFLRA
ncbi:MAG: CoA pyrophosphatase [Oxalobacter sp.]|nr:MAG: CoA pyrophosphatase [Oxalobacter sp.]